MPKIHQSGDTYSKVVELKNINLYNKNMDNNSSKNNSSLLYFALITINTFFGLQILSTFISLLSNFLRERPNMSLTDVGIYALVTFIMVFFAKLPPIKT